MVQLNTFKGSTYVIVTLLVSGANEAKSKEMTEKLMCLGPLATSGVHFPRTKRVNPLSISLRQAGSDCARLRKPAQGSGAVPS